MARKQSSEPTSDPEKQALESRVAAMMDEATPDDVTSTEIAAPQAVEPIDIFSDPATAPKVPAQLLKEIGAEPSEPASEPSVEQKITSPAVTDIDDRAVDQAVDEIVASESDAVLAAEDAAVGRTNIPAKSGLRSTFVKPFKSKKFWIIVVALLLVIFAVPITRYKVLGLVIKRSVTVVVTDSTSATKVSNAVVRVGSATAKTDGNGTATLKVPLGPDTVLITKQYYRDFSQKFSVSFKATTKLDVKLVAEGRQVPITVINKITGKPLAGAEIKILDTTSKTDKQGKAIIVLPTSAVSDSAYISGLGFNAIQANVKVTSSVVPENSFALTPAGTVYFLSNLSGKIDLVKSNLDGEGRQTVMAGTGNEDANTTSLLATRDWRYVVYKVRRETDKPVLYVIDTTNDKITEFDSGDADFTLIGWYGHSFIYDVLHSGTAAAQTGHEALKSYDAEIGQLSLLDQSQAEGSAASYASQSFYNFYILDNLVVYNTQWSSYDNSGKTYDFGTKTNTIRGVQPNGQNKKDYQTFPVNGSGYIQAALSQPQEIYYGSYNYLDNKTTYYKFENQAVNVATDVNQSSFSKPYPTYLVSPSGNQTFWAELRDGKNSLFVGNNNAQNAKQIASLSDYTPYGWYGDDYLLVSKNNSELYVIPASGLSSDHTPLKLTDYYKPPQSYGGYGYGYGGL